MGVISRSVHKASEDEVERMKPLFRSKFIGVFGEEPEDLQCEWVSDDINVGPHVAFWTEGYRFVLLRSEDDPEDVELFSYDDRQFRTIRSPGEMADMVRNNERVTEETGNGQRTTGSGR